MDPIYAANELAFRVGFSGHSGHLRLEPLTTPERHNPLRSIPDYIPPPAFPSETPESIKKYIEETYLQPRLDPDEFSAEKVGRQWEFDWFDRAEVPLEPSLPRTMVIPVWEPPFRRSNNGSVKGIWEPKFEEVDVSDLKLGETESGPLPRTSGKDFVRGSINNRPFRPGGLDDSRSVERVLPEGASNGEWVREILNGGPAQTIPPSLKQGLDFGELKSHPCSWNVCKEANPLQSSSVEKLSELSVQFDDLFKKAWEEDADGEQEQDEVESVILEAEVGTAEVSSKPHDSETSLDDILSVDSEGPELHLDGFSDEIEQMKKEAWAMHESSDRIVDCFHELVPDMALEFPFELDAFQKEAIYYLEKGESVFVAAHTSAGKTVVAEYAFALASKHCTRAVYTAPIKTISNQKYRDFCGKFDVGLLTGDVSLRPEASCLIMTTEILRSMLYRGADIIRDIEWVIFDEVHYVNDVDRGVVWEEVIIMLPRHINIVLLSATVPNTIEFADWIGRTKQKEIRVTGTTKRPVPLEHCLYHSGELYKICESETFLPQGLKAAKEVSRKRNLTAGGASGPKVGISAGHENARGSKRENISRMKQHGANFSGTGRGYQNNSNGQSNWELRRADASMWLMLINKLSKKSLLPVVIFCFSKNRCDKSADSLTRTDLTSSSEKSEIRLFCDKAFSRLKGSDKYLPQVVRVQNLLRRGIGVHHAGLLPIVKEVVEMLFCRGVIKVLFSTETFAMGVNAPARTVVFDSLRKFDGKEFRQLLSGEYTQMAGRAGRRGLDKIGTVILICRDELPEESDLKRVIVGSATRLESQFRLTYIMILHLLRVEELKVEDMLKRSFAEFHAQKKLPEMQQLLKRKLDQPRKAIECIKGEPTIEEYYDLYSEAETYNNQISEAILQSPNAQQFLNRGRVVIVKSESAQDHLLGVVVKTPSPSNKTYIVFVIKPDMPSLMQSASSGAMQNKSGSFDQGYFVMPKSRRGLLDEYSTSVSARKGKGIINITMPYCGSASGMGYEVREVDSKEFLCICSTKIKIDPVGLLEDVSSSVYSKTVQLLVDLKSDGNKYPPALDPVRDLKLRDVKLVAKYQKWTRLLEKMSQNQCHGCIKLEEHLKLAKEIKKHEEEVYALQFQMSDEALKQMPDFQGRIDVLKKIECIDEDLVVQMKGRVACEMNSGEELICTECLFENQMDELEPEEAVAIMSAFVFQQRNTSEPSLTPKLAEAKQRVLRLLKYVSLLMFLKA
ncbi:DExH-box ATP-dependent RNA helicase DExH11 isoform X2 [Vigna angularis]|uniref:DExH-box ATP-dependent RNA helicase DExH11 isoform X2 n=1 Tax=Phaseolus angularis TaxID=3914 RepID=UPI000809EF49|nr:DExH-box ATP-dependent RNA helicase DExH11 isoform X2 [Vigna angularis]